MEALMSTPVLTTPSSIHPTTTYRVHLTYFKGSGKYYSSGQYQTSHEELHQIFQEVKGLVQSGQLPGLRQGASFNTLIEVPDHPHNHPHLIMTEEAS
jgi:hypothetical protein